MIGMPFESLVGEDSESEEVTDPHLEDEEEADPESFFQSIIENGDVEKYDVGDLSVELTQA